MSGKQRGFGALGLREIGREAGLNPNTFYRHFRDRDELGLVILQELSRDLSESLRRMRRSPADVHGAVSATVPYFFEFVRANPDAFMVAGRELHGASPAMRRAIRQTKETMAAELAEDVRAGALAPGLDDATVLEVCTAINDQLFSLALDYLEQPKRHRALVERGMRFAVMLTAGALALHSAERTGARD